MEYGSIMLLMKDGMSMEADDYLPKPASADEILESVKQLVE